MAHFPVSRVLLIFWGPYLGKVKFSSFFLLFLLYFNFSFFSSMFNQALCCYQTSDPSCNFYSYSATRVVVRVVFFYLDRHLGHTKCTSSTVYCAFFIAATWRIKCRKSFSGGNLFCGWVHHTVVVEGLDPSSRFCLGVTRRNTDRLSLPSVCVCKCILLLLLLFLLLTIDGYSG